MPQFVQINDTKNNPEKIISVDHITIRQSIFFLLGKLIFLEVIAAIGMIIFYSFFVIPQTVIQLTQTVFFMTLFVFSLFISCKILGTVYVIFEWLQEYYEITPKEIIHRSGLFFKDEEYYSLDHLGMLTLEQGLVGKFCNYGTLKLYNWAIEKDILLYHIHSPIKYFDILQKLLPQTDMKRHAIREVLFETHA